MFKNVRAFSSFSVNDIEAAKRFYGETLGLSVKDGPMGTLQLDVSGGSPIMVYPKPTHTPATFTILNLPVPSVEEAASALRRRGIKFEVYSGEGGVHTDAQGLALGKGPKMAWFKDPAGNILSILERKE
jgi:catechol 2,3-dioxygenase-like lactoylglutathione lyase family enzyme